MDEKLLKLLDKRLKTIMIGSIHKFENAFGYLWNHGYEPTNNKEEFFRDKWEDLRYELLNHGNHQIRLAMLELKDYINNDSKYQYNYKFIVKSQNQENGE